MKKTYYYYYTKLPDKCKVLEQLEEAVLAGVHPRCYDLSRIDEEVLGAIYCAIAVAKAEE